MKNNERNEVLVLAEWLFQLWSRDEPPERVEVWQLFGRNKNDRGKMIHHQDFRPGDKVDIERANRLANEIIAAAQNDCDSVERKSWYEIAVVDKNRRSIPIVRRLGPLYARKAPYDPRLGDTCFAVEATSFEKLALWEEWHNKVEWAPDLSGLAPTIGHFGGMPIVLNLFWSRIGGIRVLFWEQVSMVTHSRMAEEWLHANCGACCEYVSAENFHTVIHSIRANGLTAESPLHAEADASRLRAMLEKVSNYLETATRICEESGEDEEDIRDSMELVAEARALLEETK